MNEVLKAVTAFTDKHKPIKNFYLFLGQLLSERFSETTRVFRKYPIEFTRLYEQQTDILFSISDEEIKENIKECFPEENAPIFGTRGWDIIMLLLLASLSSKREYIESDNSESVIIE